MAQVDPTDLDTALQSAVAITLALGDSFASPPATIASTGEGAGMAVTIVGSLVSDGLDLRGQLASQGWRSTAMVRLEEFGQTLIEYRKRWEA